jgi:hypothetical protein
MGTLRKRASAIAHRSASLEPLEPSTPTTTAGHCLDSSLLLTPQLVSDERLCDRRWTIVSAAAAFRPHHDGPYDRQKEDEGREGERE